MSQRNGSRRRAVQKRNPATIKVRPATERLEERTLLTGSQVSIFDVSIPEGTSGITTVSGTLSPGVEANAYRFTGSAGQHLTFHDLTDLSNQVNWTLYGPNNQYLTSSNLTNDLSDTLPAEGVYELIVGGYNTSAPVTYSFQVVDSTEAPPSAGTTGFGTEHTGSIAAGTTKAFTYTASAGQFVYFDNLDTSGSSSLYYTLTDPTNANVFAAYYGNDQNPVSLPHSGTYTLTVAGVDSSAVGAFDFNLESVPAAATALTLGATTSGTLNPGSQAAIYSFSGAAGQRLYFDGLSAPSGANVQVLDPSGNNVVSISSTNDGTPFTLTEPGTYHLIVTNGATATASPYSFRLLDVAAQPTLPLDGSTQSVALPAMASAVYTFTGTAGESVFLNDLTSNASPYYAARWTLYGPANQNVNSNYLYVGGDIPATLPESGTYTLVFQNSYAPEVDATFNAFQTTTATAALTLGTAVSGTLANPGDTNVYTFAGTAGQRLYFDGLTSDPSLNAQLIDPNGNVVYVNGGTSSDVAPFTLVRSGAYSIVVSGSGHSTGSYSFRLLDVAAQPTLPLDGSTQSVALPAMASAVYTFTGTAGESVFLNDLTSNASPYYAARWTLYGPANQNVNSNYLYVGGDIPATLPESGTYTLVFQNNSAPEVDATFKAFQTATTTAPLTLGTAVSGTLANPGDQNTYTFAGAAGQRLYFDGLTSDPGLNAQLIDPNGTVVNINGALTTDVAPFTLAQSGAYRLVVTGGGHSTGSYSFNLLDVAAQPTLAIDGATQSAAFTPGIQSQLYTITGTAGQKIFFDNVTDSGVYYNGYTTLYGPTNQSVGGNYVGSYFSVTLPSAGSYTLVMAGSSTTPFNVTFRAIPFTNPTAALTLGATASSTLANPGDQQTYTFTGTAGQSLFYDGLSADGGLNAQLVDTFGNVVGVNTAPQNDQGPFTLTQSGTYRLVISGSGASVGAFSFRVLNLSAATTLPLDGSTTSGTLDPGTSTNLYRFTGSAGERIYLQNVSNDNTSGSIYLYGPNNQQITGVNISNDLSVTLPTAGTYTIAVQGYSATALAYSFSTFTSTTSTTALTLGTTTSGTLTNPGDQADYTFTGAVGQRLYFDGISADPSLGVQLFNPSGTNVFVNTAPQNDQGPFTLTQAGTYRIHLFGGGHATGNFSFRVLDLSAATTLPLDGTTVSGTLDPGTSTNLYTFNVAAGQRIYLQNVSNGNTSGSIYLYGPNNQNVTGVNISGDLSATLPTAGTYTIAVQGYSATALTYSFKSFAYPSAVATSALTLGSTVSGTLTNPGDQADYTFTGAVGQRLYFDGISADPSLGVQLFNPSGTNVFVNTAPQNDQGPFTLTQAGTYRIHLFGGGHATGNFSFRVLDLSAATTLPLDGTTVSGTLNPGTSDQAYQFTANAGRRLTFTSVSADNNSTGWTLYGPNNQYVSSSNITGNFDTFLPEDGTYTLVVAGSSNVAFHYSVKVVDNTETVVGASGFGTVQSGTLAAGASQTFTYTGSAGQLIFLNGQDVGSPSINVRLDTADNSANVFSIYTSYGDSGPYRLPHSGSYTLTVTNNGGSTGTFGFNLLALPADATPLTLNTTYTNTLSPSTATDVYSFTGTAGQKLYFDPVERNNDGVGVVLLGPAGETVFSTNAENDYSIPALPESGTYYLYLQGNQASSDYSFRLIDAATYKPTLTLPTAAVTGTLTPGLATDAYQFDAVAGERVYLGNRTFSSTNGTFYIYNPDGSYYAQLGFSSDYLFTAPTTGRYTLDLAGNDASPITYSFTLATPATNVSTLTLGTDVSGTISAPDQQDVYTFTGAPGQRVFFDALLATNPGNVYATLTGPSGENIFNYAYASNDYHTSVLPEAGTYRLTVFSNTDTTGAYKFNLIDAGAQPVLALPTAAPVSGTLTPGLRTAVYQFDGTAGETIHLGNQSFTSPNGYFYLYGPDGTYLSQTYFGNPLTYTLPTTGRYVLAVSSLDSTDASNAYSFTIATPTTNTSALTLGTDVSGTIAVPGQQDEYTFTGTAGQRLYFDALADNSNIYITLNGPAGQNVYNYYAYDRGSIILPVGGTYSLIVSTYNNSTGPYKFNLLDIAAQPTIDPTASPTVSGTLTPGLRTALYQFDGTAGQRILLSSQTFTSNSGNFYIYGPDGTDLSNPGFGSDSVYTLPTTGRYTLAVNSNDSTDTSNAYSFVISAPPTVTQALMLGADTSGNLAVPGQQDVYTFTGAPGQRLLYDALDGTDHSLYIRLTSPGGAAVYYYYYYYYNNSISDQPPITLTEAGTYQLSFISSTAAGTGSYRFRLIDAGAGPTIVPSAAPTVTGTITPGLGLNAYEFDGTAGQRLFFGSQSFSSSNGSFILYGPNNQQVGSSTFGQDFEPTLPTDGRYILVVSGTDTANPITYSFVPSVSVTNVSALTLGADTSGNLTTPGQQDIYTFTGTAGQRLYYDALSNTDNGIYVRLTSPSGANVNYYYYNASYDEPPFILPEAGTYRLSFVGSNVDSTGAYRFRLIDLATQPVATLPTAAPISGTLSPGLATNAYQFDGTAGEVVVFANQTFSSSSGTYVIYGPDNNYVSQFGFGQDTSVTLPKNGRYTVLLEGSNPNVAITYSFGISTPPTNVQSLALNTDTSGNISALGQTDVYTFAGTAGQRLYYDALSTTDYGLYVRLTSPGGANVTYFYNNSITDEGPVALPESGTYTLTVFGSNVDSTGSYRFRLLDLAAQPRLDLNTTEAVFTVSLDAPSTVPVEIHYATADGTGTAGVDYQATDGTLLFNPGQTSQTISVGVIRDSRDEANRTFVVNLSEPVNATVNPTNATATGTIVESTGPNVTVGDTTVAEVQGSTTTANFTVSLSATSADTVTVNYATTALTAVAGTDYIAALGTLTFAPGETSKTVIVAVPDDSQAGGNKTFALDLTSATGGQITRSRGTATITDPDQFGSLEFAVANTNVGEADGTATVQVNRVGGADGIATVHYTTSDGTADSADYTATSGTLTFAAGQTTASFTVPITNEHLSEGQETINLTLSSPTGGATLGTPSTSLITIQDTNPTVAISSPSVDEGNSAAFTVTLSSPTTQVVTVNYTTTALTAVAGTDYTAASGTLTFAPGVTTQTIYVGTIEDYQPGGNSTFAVDLSAPTNATIPSGNSRGTATIVDPDQFGNFQFASSNTIVGAGGGTATIQVNRYGGADGIATVHYTTSDGTADSADYTTTSGTLTFAAGQTTATFTVPITNEHLSEGQETINLTLSSPTGGATLGTTDTSLITIRDANPNISIADTSVTEIPQGTTASFAVTLSSPTTQTVTVDYTTTPLTAHSPDDFGATSGTLTFLAGQTVQYVTVSVPDDGTATGNQTFAVDLSNPANGQIVRSRGTATIIDPDAFGSLEFHSSTYSIAETGGPATIQVDRIGGASDGAVTVHYATSDGTADSADYTATSGTLTFAAGQTTATFTVPITNEHRADGQETVNLTLSAPTGGATIGTQSTSVLTIQDTTPVLSIADTSVAEVQGGSYATFTVRLSTPSAFTVSANYTTTPLTAVAGVDYLSASGTVTFAPNQVSQVINVFIPDDAATDGNSTFALDLNAPTNATLGTARGIATIVDPDMAGTLQFHSTNYNVAEDGGSVTIQVDRVGGADGTATVHYATSDGTADSADYTATSGTLTFAAGQTTATFTVPITNEHRADGQETVNLTLSAATGATLGSSASAAITIQDGTSALSISDTSVTEVEGGTATASFTVTLSSPSTQTVTVTYATRSLTATSPTDFQAQAGTLTFAPGVTSQTINIAVLDDSNASGDETFAIDLGSSSGATIARSRGVATIVDPNTIGAFQFHLATVTATESGGPVTIQVDRVGGTDGAVTVHYATSDGTADSADYTATSGTLTFAAGQTTATFTVPITNEHRADGQETVNLTLSAPTGGATIGTQSTSVLTIQDTVPALTNFVVQHGVAERSYVRYLDLTFASADGLSSLINSVDHSPAASARVKLIYRGLDGSGSTVVPLALKLQAIDKVIEVDFGPNGIGGDPNTPAGDGYYTLQIDPTGNGVYTTSETFYRLLGDVVGVSNGLAGDHAIGAADLLLVSNAIGQSGPNLQADVNGDGAVTSADRNLIRRYRNHKISGTIHLDA